MSGIKCFVINLPRSPERCVACTQHLEQLNLNYEVFPATDGFNLSEQELHACDLSPTHTLSLGLGRKVIMDNPLAKGEIGCALSHLRVYQHILQQNLPYACVIEDDCLVKPSFKTALESIASLESLTNFKHSWDLICFAQNSSVRNWPWAPKVFLDKSHECYLQPVGLPHPWLNALFNTRRLVYGTFLYVISAKACQRLLKLGYPVRFPSDILTGHIAFNRLKIWQVYPKASYFADFESFSSLIVERPKHDLHKL